MRFDGNRLFGVEIECSSIDIVDIDMDDEDTSIRQIARAIETESGITCRAREYAHVTVHDWTVTSDGSLHGDAPFELVSPPLRGLRGLGEVGDMVAALNRRQAHVNRSCGLHLHHDARDYTHDQLVNAQFYYETFKSVFLPVVKGRLDSEYAPSVSPRMARNNRRYDPEQRNRYTAVNIAAYARHGTLEYRQHAATLNATEIVNWIVFTQQIHVSATRRTTRLVVKRRQDAEHLKRAFWDYLGLYNKEPVDDTCASMLQYYAKQCGWHISKLLNVRRGTL